MATVNRDAGGVIFTNGVATKIDSSDVTATPTAAELIAAFGPAANTRGFIFLQDDNGAGAIRIVVSDGTSYHFSAALTKAT